MTEGHQLATGFNVPEDHMYDKGLTKREHFAAMAIQGLTVFYEHKDMTCKDIAALAVECADELIAALNAKEGA